MSTLSERALGTRRVPPIGLGCMNLSHAYGVPPSPEIGRAVLQKALDIGITHFDSAALYGFGRNEELVGPFLATHCDDKVTPIEESVGMLSRFVEQGKVKEIGLSEVSAMTIRKAHAVHPIAAVQSEYSLWSRNVEIAVLDVCVELGISFVAFSPLARGLLTSVDIDPVSFADKDVRRGMPRFQEPRFSENMEWLPEYRAIAIAVGCTPAQLALAWVPRQGEHVHAIAGRTCTTIIKRLKASLRFERNLHTIDRWVAIEWERDVEVEHLAR